MVMAATKLPEGYDVDGALARLEERSAAIVRQSMRPPPRLSVSEWAARYRVLPDTAARPGKWRNDEAPYLVGVMDACSDPGVERVVFMKPSQVGGTECINNVLGYFIHQDPSPILVVQYSVDEAHKWSKERFSAMVKDTPELDERVASAKSRDSDNTILSKSFPGGHLGVVGANAPSGLSARPRRVILIDEVDRFPPSAGTEGDPVNLAIKRTRTFWNRLVFLNSSPGLEGTSRIADAYRQTDQRKYFVPCPSCGAYQTLEWDNLRWDKHPDRKGPSKHLAHTARYACAGCGDLIPEAKKAWMVRAGEWRATSEDGRPGWAGFNLNALYALWVPWADLVGEWVEATSPQLQPEKLQVFVNTTLGQPYDPAGSGLDPDSLQARAEDYPADPVPEGVCVITAGVDVQHDRLEVEFVGWGIGQESWSLDYLVLRGDPSVHRIWDEDLHHALTRTWEHPSGARLRLAAAGVDSGAWTQQVYRFTKSREQARIWAFKGSGQQGRPIISHQPSRRNKRKAALFWIGTDSAKAAIYQRLEIEHPGAGYMHFPTRYPETYYKGLTAEKQVKRRNKRGYVVREWVKKPGVANEPLDCRVYAYAALEGLEMGGMDIGRIAEHLAELKAGGGKAKPKTRRRRVFSEGVA